MASDFRLGFENLERETHDLRLHPASGTVPEWLRGSLIRTGPTIFSLRDEAYRHWFDGLAMLQKFAFEGGQARYTGRLLRSPDYLKSTARGRVASDEFVSVPRRSLWERLVTLVEPERQFGRNGMVNVLGLTPACAIAMTENPLAVQFDPRDLSTVGPFDYGDDLASILNMVTTAHPVRDQRSGAIYNFVSRLIPLRPRYVVYRIDPGPTTRTAVATVETDALSYMHSFGLSDRYVILTEFPLVTHPSSLFLMPLFGTPYIKSYAWQPGRGTRFHVLDKRDGRRVGTWEHEACFAFHHVHAQEHGDELLVDLSVYEHGPHVIDQFMMAHLRGPEGGIVDPSTLRRYRLPLRGGPVREERLAEPVFEMPRLNPRPDGGYRYAYGVSFRSSGDFVNQLVKIDVDTGTHRVWHEPGCYPGEPVFVARGPGAEDDGVAVSVVLDARRGHSFLLLLDGTTFEARARLDLPHAIPFMLHGQFFEGVV
jgi:carotenoid cleavage dioxygenase-like enzyme